ncbi:hypothetical protein N7468_009690 [Penicillium chermesinum]|uniref:Uncharacterized protein n=1 Tax=Penicillium chermesinum TaxID=63820 RepID=A0A9W9NI80_9EURO|nr:uncharacterized protein N7468_009690 [Penicillium chermesinum]KAJ5220486.1 hypothetical protein N7468_009690 [Penicillium chermesinum]
MSTSSNGLTMGSWHSQLQEVGKLSSSERTELLDRISDDMVQTLSTISRHVQARILTEENTLKISKVTEIIAKTRAPKRGTLLKKMEHEIEELEDKVAWLEEQLCEQEDRRDARERTLGDEISRLELQSRKQKTRVKKLKDENTWLKVEFRKLARNTDILGNMSVMCKRVLSREIRELREKVHHGRLGENDHPGQVCKNLHPEDTAETAIQDTLVRTTIHSRNCLATTSEAETSCYVEP